MGYVIHNCEQRTPEWDALRSGRITASIANKLVTPGGKASVGYKAEAGRIIAEANGWQKPDDDDFTSYWMGRGIALEDEARGWMQVETGQLVHQCGFISHDEWIAGFSPDGYVMQDDILIPCELKCPKPSTHIQWLAEGGVPKVHLPQVHFGMALTDAEEALFMSYSPTMKPLFETVKRNAMTELMVKRIQNFTSELKAMWEMVTGTPYPESKGENE